MSGYRMVVAAGLLAVIAAGCRADRPEQYGRVRPPVDDIDMQGRGLQSKDVVAATDQLAMDLLSLPELGAAETQWTIVLTDVENRTADPRFSYDIFIERLRGNISRHGRGRVQIIENQARLRDLQRRELDHERDDFGQGPAGVRPGPAGIQPDYALYGQVMEMPGRGRSYYLANFHLTNLQTRQQVWTGTYEVTTAR